MSDIARVHTAATTNATSIKTGSGLILGFYLFNSSASAVYLKLFDKASAPIVGTDTPLFTVGIPAGGGCCPLFTNGIDFQAGIAYAVTGSAADGDTTAVAAAALTGMIIWR